MKLCGRKPKLTPEQVKEARERYFLHVSNSLERIAHDMGIHRKTLVRYLNGRHKNVTGAI